MPSESNATERSGRSERRSAVTKAIKELALLSDGFAMSEQRRCCEAGRSAAIKKRKLHIL